jgi:hypothetical protein
VSDLADAAAYAIAGQLSKSLRAAPVIVQAATGRVTLTTIQRVKLPEPKRARIVEAAACLLNVTPAVARAELDLWIAGSYTLADLLEQHADSAETPREAWELLAMRGLIPAAWVDSPRRAFDTGRTIVGELLADVVRQLEQRYLGAALDARVATAVTRDAVRLIANRISMGAETAGRGIDVRVTDGRVTITLANWLRASLGDRSIRTDHPTTIAACLAFAADVRGVLDAEAIATSVTKRDHVAWRIDSDYHRALSESSRRIDTPAWWAPLHEMGYEFGATDDDTVTLVAPELGA